jgi:hypothetical protein
VAKAILTTKAEPTYKDLLGADGRSGEARPLCLGEAEVIRDALRGIRNARFSIDCKAKNRKHIAMLIGNGHWTSGFEAN